MDLPSTKTIRKRCFNQIEVDEQRLILTKTSDEYTKFISEVKWYLSLPDTLRRYIPRLIGHSLDPLKAYVELEYLTWPTVGSLFTSGLGEVTFWRDLFRRVFQLIDDMRQFSEVLSPVEDRVARNAMFVQKTTQRLDILRADPVLGAFFCAKHCINGEWYQPLDEYLVNLESLCHTYLLTTAEPLTLIHGDLCASNILCDSLRTDIRVIDPRGDFGGRGMYGDYRYDLAKLSHSFCGRYDLLVADMYRELKIDRDIVAWELGITSKQREIGEAFSQGLAAYAPKELKAVEFIEGLLFLSMVPLHRESKDRQIVLFATGIAKFARFVESSNV